MLRPPRLGFVLLSLLVAVVLPALVFVVVGIGTGMGLSGTWSALIAQASGRRLNPFMIGVVSALPVLLLLAVLLFVRWRLPEAGWLAAAGWGGFGAILMVLLWANVGFWTDFLPSGTAPSWPGGMELVIGPIFFAPVAAVVGLIAGAFAGRGTKWP